MSTTLLEELSYQRLTHLLGGHDEAAAEYGLVIRKMLGDALMSDSDRVRLSRRAERKALARLKHEQPGPGLDDAEAVPQSVRDRTYAFRHRVPGVEMEAGS